MKKLMLLSGLLLIGPRFAFAVDGVWSSSNTAAAVTTKTVCPQGFSTKSGRGIFHGVCVNNEVAGLTGSFTVYNASGSAVNPIAQVNSARGGCSYYDVGFSSGLSYTSVSTANVTMMYECH